MTSKCRRQGLRFDSGIQDVDSAFMPMARLRAVDDAAGPDVRGHRPEILSGIYTPAAPPDHIAGHPFFPFPRGHRLRLQTGTQADSVHSISGDTAGPGRSSSITDAAKKIAGDLGGQRGRMISDPMAVPQRSGRNLSITRRRKKENRCWKSVTHRKMRAFRPDKSCPALPIRGNRKVQAPKGFCATGPNPVWRWEITWLAGPVAGLFFYLFMFVDILSRKIVGWEVHHRETAEPAAT